MERVVIVGAGQAGHACARALRAEGFAGEVLLLGAEPDPPYERPPLSKEVLLEEALPDLPGRLPPIEPGVSWRGGVEVVALDRAGRRVHTRHGETIGYDALVLATGGRAARPPVPGAEDPRLPVLRDIADARRLRAGLRGGWRHLAILGGGFIGLEVAAAARLLGVEATVIEAADRLCARALPPALSEWLRATHEASGVRVLLSARAALLAPDGVTLADGTRIAADAVLVATGLKPNDELAREAGLPCAAAGGILADAAGRTEDPAVFAIGDVVALRREGLPPIRLESWAQANAMGAAAARAILGLPDTPPPLPWFWSTQGKTLIQMAGLPDGATATVTRGDPASGSFLMFLMAGDRIAQAIAVNNSREFQLARRLVERGIAVPASALADPGFALKAALR
ncbi:MAG: FAD-dependent oxidoreductase [Acetobacteraceae bacterium]|nr:FAD-dependent oxidoreductase [Acetobacteraceae bacterium]